MICPSRKIGTGKLANEFEPATPGRRSESRPPGCPWVRAAKASRPDCSPRRRGSSVFMQISDSRHRPRVLILTVFDLWCGERTHEKVWTGLNGLALVIPGRYTWNHSRPKTRKKASFSKVFWLERVMGIEPTWPAWKAGALPLSYTRIRINSNDNACLVNSPP